MKKGLMALHKFYIDGKLTISEEGYRDLLDLADIVIAKHFYLNLPEEKEELKSVGITKALELLHKGAFDPSKSDLKSFLYTGMRNEMGNFVYRSSRSFPVDNDIMTSNIDAINSVSLRDISEEVVTITLEEIKEFSRSEIDVQSVVNSLIKTGFLVKGAVYSDVPVIPERVAIIQCLVIWKHLEFYQY